MKREQFRSLRESRAFPILELFVWILLVCIAVFAIRQWNSVLYLAAVLLMFLINLFGNMAGIFRTVRGAEKSTSKLVFYIASILVDLLLIGKALWSLFLVRGLWISGS